MADGGAPVQMGVPTHADVRGEHGACEDHAARRQAHVETPHRAGMHNGRGLEPRRSHPSVDRAPSPRRADSHQVAHIAVLAGDQPLLDTAEVPDVARLET